MRVNIRYIAKIVSESGMPITGILDTTKSPAEYFTACVIIALDMMNGGRDLSKRFMTKIANHDIDVETFKASFLPIFVSNIHEHPAFASNAVLNEQHPLYNIFSKIANLLSRDINDGDLAQDFLKILPQFKVDGIRSITIRDLATSINYSNSSMFKSKSIFATPEQPYGPYADAFTSPKIN